MVEADWNMCHICNNRIKMQYESYVYISVQKLFFYPPHQKLHIIKYKITRLIICSQDKRKHNVYLNNV